MNNNGPDMNLHILNFPSSLTRIFGVQQSDQCDDSKMSRRETNKENTMEAKKMDKESKCNKFKLFELSIGHFAVIKSDVETVRMPINVYGFIIVFMDNMIDNCKYKAIMESNWVSDELEASNEIERLKQEAILITIEAVADEFGD